MGALGLAWLYLLPSKKSELKEAGYAQIIKMMGCLLISLQRLKPRLLIMFMVFTGFTVFWATVPIMLMTDLGFTQPSLAWLSLAALAAPPCVILAGRLTDKGWAAQ